MKHLSYLNKYFFKYKWHLLLGLVFVILNNIFGIVPAQLVRKGIDYVSGEIKKISGSGETTASIIVWRAFIFCMLIIGATVVKGIFMFFMRQTIIIMSRLIEYDLKNEIYSHYQLLPLSFYRRNNTGDLMNRISEDVNRVRMYIGPAVMYTINLVVLFILVIIAMLRVNAHLTFYVLLPLPFLSISIYLVSDKMNRLSDNVQEQQSMLSTFVQEAFSGIRILKSYVKEQQSENEFRAESADYMNRSMKLVQVNAMFFPLMMLLVGISTLVVIYVGGQEVIAGHLTLGNIAEFIIYVNLLTWPIASVGWVTSLVQRAAASQARLNEFLNVQPEIISAEMLRDKVEGNVEFRNVDFVYPDSGIHALKNISFKMEKGKSLAVLGRTGSGKSTLAQLMLRMYDPGSGSILVDGTDIRSFDPGFYRSSIGYVPQDVFLFSDTIANNIAFGITEPDKNLLNEKIISAAKDADIYDNIMAFPEGFETVIGERGITLSGGQKQRVSIARAIIRQPRMLLFDDCLSAVDTQTEENILNNLKKIMTGRTTIIISHRVSSVKNADNIVVLENGSIAGRGTHATLLETKGLYAEMYERQLLEEEISRMT